MRNQKIIHKVEDMADIIFDNSNNVDTLVEYTVDLIARIILYKDVQDTNTYIEKLSTAVEQLYIEDNN